MDIKWKNYEEKKSNKHNKKQVLKIKRVIRKELEKNNIFGPSNIIIDYYLGYQCCSCSKIVVDSYLSFFCVCKRRYCSFCLKDTERFSLSMPSGCRYSSICNCNFDYYPTLIREHIIRSFNPDCNGNCKFFHRVDNGIYDCCEYMEKLMEMMKEESGKLIEENIALRLQMEETEKLLK